MLSDFPDVLTIENLQKALSIGRTTAYRLIASGAIKHWKIGNVIKIPKPYLLNYIANSCYPASKITLPKKERYDSDFYTAEEIRRLLEIVKGTKLETPVMLCAWFGMRRGEACGLRHQDIDYKAMTVSVKGVITDKGSGSRSQNMKYRLGAKTRSGLRTFPLPPEVADYLKKLQQRQAVNRALQGNSYITKWQDFICVDIDGDLIKPEYLSRAFPALLEKHGLRRIRLHDLRGSNASLLLDKGVDMKMLQLWLGHSNFSTTADIYAKHQVNSKLKLGGILSEELAIG
jgi:excisionase family DNA binding protein